MQKKISKEKSDLHGIVFLRNFILVNITNISIKMGGKKRMIKGK